MPATASSRPAGTANERADSNTFIDNYLADWNDDDNPFRSPSPEPAGKKAKDDGKKKKDVLGIEKEIDLKKKPRAPRVKLDEARLLSEKGIPKLRKMAPRLKLKGKGHEFSDAARLLSFYQDWLDDLFPKATFLDALAMVEKEGHKTAMRNARLKWIDECRPKATFEAEEEGEFPGREQQSSLPQPERIAPIFENASRERPTTPTRDEDDLFGDDDIYNATPRPRTDAQSSAQPPRQMAHDVPDEDDLDALMAEAESGVGARQNAPGAASGAVQSISGNPSDKGFTQQNDELEEDDLDALMAEVEVQPAPTKPGQPGVAGSMSRGENQRDGGDEDDLDALMAEAEAEAEAVVQTASQSRREGNASAGTSTQVNSPPGSEAAARQSMGFEDEEEVMAEMDGLW
ncbi:Swi3-domain-containing protein [Canariomyces notabilis]|uniref:Chromosome segregation in meiosis protein n=1 Tax=Canariomyces notabilis TaxID=2074819 RepID=A0AAN6TNQ7_9PEZI|nr:Swi3-domain-containing protein [Canariomyces arenarius]